MFEVRRGARCSAKCRRVERAASRSEEEDAPEAAADLEPTRAKVPMRNAVGSDVENRPQNDRCEPRAAGGSSRSACRNVEGDDHGHCLAESRSSSCPGQDGIGSGRPQTEIRLGRLSECAGMSLETCARTVRLRRLDQTHG